MMRDSTIRFLADLVQDCRFTLRQFRRAPGLHALLALTLAAGIGGNATMVGVIRRLLFRNPQHVREPDRVVRLLLVSPDGQGGNVAIGAANYPMVIDLQREAPAFVGVAGFTRRRLSLNRGIDAIELTVTLVTPEFFTVLGAKPILGRVFDATDRLPRGDTPGGPALAVLANGFWARQFGSDTAIIGRSLQIGELSYTVAGVMPVGFAGIEAEAPDVWLPLPSAAADPSVLIDLSSRTSLYLSVLARLSPGSTPATAAQQATPIWESIVEGRRDAAARSRLIAASIIPARGPDAPREIRLTFWLGGVAIMLLFISCANVANLLLARAHARRREVAARIAIGASPGRLAQQLLTEGVVLAAAASVAALALVWFTGPLLIRIVLKETPTAFLDARLLLSTAVVALGTGLLVSLVPALQSLRADLTTAMRTGASTSGGRTRTVRHALLAWQSALCMLLVTGAGLFAISFAKVRALDLGLDVEHTIIARLNLNRLALPTSSIDAIHQDAVTMLKAVPGVTQVALVDNDPFFGGRAVAAYTPTRSASELWERGASEVAMEVAVGDGFFRTIGAASLRGRDFTEGDAHGAPRVAILNEPLARMLYPRDEPIGKCIILPERSDVSRRECVTVVGVTRGFWRTSIINRHRLIAYVPLAQATPYFGMGRPQGVIIRTSGDPAPLIDDIRRILQGVRAEIPAVRVRLIRDIVGAQMRPWLLGATMFGLFAALALIVALIGVYGVVAFTAEQRSFEIAVRRAVGASRRNIISVVAGEGMKAVAIGLLVGAAAILAFHGWVGPLLFQTSASDLRIVLGVATLVAAVASFAILKPVVRALRQDPVVALRVD